MIPEYTPKDTLEIHLIRHAESEDNIRSGYFGSLNPQLTSHGRKQAKQLGEYLYRRHFRGDAYCVASDYDRARETMEILRVALMSKDQQEYQQDPRLREIHRGDWTDKPFSIIEQDPESCRRFRAYDPDFRPPNGESMNDVGLRMYQCLLDIAQVVDLGSGPRKAIVLSHGRAIQALHMRIAKCRQEVGIQYVIDNTSITTLEFHTKAGWRFRRINSTPHLDL